MRAPIAILALALSLLAIAGCGSKDDATPVACLEGAGTYLKALEDAPGEVRLKGETPISDCLPENQKGGELAGVGTTMVTVATKLNSEALANPGARAGLQLGYLLGAAQRGADRTQGIHSELIRRLAVAARYSPDNHPLPPKFLAAYREGFDAGHTGG
jgi:hypothetical protein